MWRASPPAFLKASPGSWGRPHLKNSPQQKIRPDCLQVPRSGTLPRPEGVLHQSPRRTLCYAIMPPGRKSAFRARFWPDCYRKNTEIGLRPAFGRPEGPLQRFPGSSPAKIRPGSVISGPEALLRNMKCKPSSRSKRQRVALRRGHGSKIRHARRGADSAWFRHHHKNTDHKIGPGG